MAERARPEPPSQAAVEVALAWSSREARHTDRRYFDRVSLAQAILPRDLSSRLADAEIGEPVRTKVEPGEAIPARDAARIVEVPRSGWRSSAARGLEPRAGRFYPRGLLDGIPGVQREDRRPMRCLSADRSAMVVDLNHPLSARELDVEIRVLRRGGPSGGTSESCVDPVGDAAASGPGMQAPLADRPTDFGAESGFERLDERPDALFYERARLVDHIDTTAIEQLRALYGRYLESAMSVLDLMSSRTSHLPAYPGDLRVTGLGMNRAELVANERLGRIDLHDLNGQPRLPYDSASFDAVLCSLSVEYLVRPIEVFSEVARVLRPGGPFVLTFSERWFPPKVIRLWTELHPFERMGWVLDGLAKAGGFERLGSESVRGLPRPADDRYAGRLADSDPIYAVWGFAAR